MFDDIPQEQSKKNKWNIQAKQGQRQDPIEEM